MNIHFRDLKCSEDIIKTWQYSKMNKNIDQEIKDIKSEVLKFNEEIAKDILNRKTNLVNAIYNKSNLN